VSPTAIALTGSTSNSFSYSIEIVFTPEVFGTFRQTVCFDFKGKPKIAKEIIVEVVPPADEDKQSDAGASNDIQAEKIDAVNSVNSMFGRNLKSKCTWNFGNAEIVSSVNGQRATSDMVGFALMTSPTLPKIENQPEKELQCQLTKENYKERMRKLIIDIPTATIMLNLYFISHY